MCFRKPLSLCHGLKTNENRSGFPTSSACSSEQGGRTSLQDGNAYIFRLRYLLESSHSPGPPKAVRAYEAVALNATAWTIVNLTDNPDLTERCIYFPKSCPTLTVVRVCLNYPPLSFTRNKVECEEFAGQERTGYGGGHATAASNAARMFEARESAVDLAVGLEEKVS